MGIENPENLKKYLTGFGIYDLLNSNDSKYGHLTENC